MKKLSTGHDSTLGSYLDLATAFFGEDSKAVEFLKNKIAESGKGKDEEVIAAENQMVFLLMHIHDPDLVNNKN